MRRWKKGLVLAAVFSALTLGLLIPASGSTAGVYLMAVNERVLETTADNMPQIVGGVLYVPYTMLSTRDTNIDLGVNAMYSNTRRTVLVSYGQRGVIFDIQSNSAADLNGVPVTARAMVRNAMVFLPIDWLCQYFGVISCSRTRTPYGTLVRVTSSAVILNDRDFVDAADSQLSSSLYRYLESGGRNEGDNPLPSEDVESSDPPSGAELFLALRPGTTAQACAQVLEGRELRALFLFTREELAQDAGFVRRVVGAGHTVGLTLAGTDLERCLEEARQGRELLAAAARCNALVVSAPGLDGAGQKALEEAGFVVWSATVLGSESASGTSLVRGLDARRVNFVELHCGAGGDSFLRSALSAMEEEHCQIYQATAPALS